MNKLTWNEFKTIMRENKKNNINGVIVFTKDSFKEEYDEMARSYRVNSSAKVFDDNMGGFSLYGDSLDGVDRMVRLDYYMEEYGINKGWKVDYCYID